DGGWAAVRVPDPGHAGGRARRATPADPLPNPADPARRSPGAPRPVGTDRPATRIGGRTGADLPKRAPPARQEVAWSSRRSRPDRAPQRWLPHAGPAPVAPASRRR